MTVRKSVLAAGAAGVLIVPAMAAPLISNAMASDDGAARIAAEGDVTPAAQAPAARLLGLTVGEDQGWVHSVDVDETGAPETVTIAKKTMLGLSTARRTVEAEQLRYHPDAQIVTLRPAAG